MSIRWSCWHGLWCQSVIQSDRQTMSRVRSECRMRQSHLIPEARGECRGWACSLDESVLGMAYELLGETTPPMTLRPGSGSVFQKVPSTVQYHGLEYQAPIRMKPLGTVLKPLSSAFLQICYSLSMGSLESSGELTCSRGSPCPHPWEWPRAWESY